MGTRDIMSEQSTFSKIINGFSKINWFIGCLKTIIVISILVILTALSTIIVSTLFPPEIKFDIETTKIDLQDLQLSTAELIEFNKYDNCIDQIDLQTIFVTISLNKTIISNDSQLKKRIQQEIEQCIDRIKSLNLKNTYFVQEALTTYIAKQLFINGVHNTKYPPKYKAQNVEDSLALTLGVVTIIIAIVSLIASFLVAKGIPMFNEIEKRQKSITQSEKEIEKIKKSIEEREQDIKHTQQLTSAQFDIHLCKDQALVSFHQYSQSKLSEEIKLELSLYFSYLQIKEQPYDNYNLILNYSEMHPDFQNFYIDFKKYVESLMKYTEIKLVSTKDESIIQTLKDRISGYKKIIKDLIEKRII